MFFRKEHKGQLSVKIEAEGRKPGEKRLGEAQCSCRFWKMSVFGAMLLCLAGCGEGQSAADSGLKDEVAKLRQEVVSLKDEVSHQKSEFLEIRRRGEIAGRTAYRDRKVFHRPPAGTNSMARAGKSSREELEARRKMMQDPEMRKKFEAEHKARMEERRRRHEERRREMEERRRARSAPETAAPVAAPAK